MDASNWKLEDNPALGFMNTWSAAIRRHELRHPGSIPDMRNGRTLFVGSDFSGGRERDQYSVFSALIINIDRCEAWNEKRLDLRRRFVPDGRRLSYKSLTDVRKKRFLWPFLEASNELNGLLVSVLVENAVPSIFGDGELRPRESGLTDLDLWNPKPAERVLRAMHFVSFLVAALSGPGQDVLWFTDEDDIAPNEECVRRVTELFVKVSGNYLTHQLNHFTFGTTICDDGSRRIEDLVALPDLAGGALASLVPQLVATYGSVGGPVIVPPPAGVPTKARLLLHWHSQRGRPLRRMVWVISQPAQGRGLMLSDLAFTESDLCVV